MCKEDTCLNKNYAQNYKKNLFSLYENTPKGNAARRLNTFSKMIASVLQTKTASLASIGKSLDSQADLESRIKSVKRALANKWNDWEFQFLPCLRSILKRLCQKNEVFLIIDGTQIGNQCTALMLSILDNDTAIPLCWVVRQMPKGVFSSDMHQSLIEKIAPIIKPYLTQSSHVIVLGDGEFSNIELQKSCSEVGFDYVFRLRKDTLLFDEQLSEEAFKPQEVAKNGNYYQADVFMTEQRYGKVHFVSYKEKGFSEPIYLISTIDYPVAIAKYYKKRFRTETLFGNIKSRGFNIHKTKVNSPTITDGLLTVVCWAYVWLTQLGKKAKENKNYSKFARKDRNDWSLLTLAWAYLDYCNRCRLKINLEMSKNST